MPKKQKTNSIDSLMMSLVKMQNTGFSLKDKIFFFRELGYLLEGGVGIVEAVSIIKSTAQNYTVKGICDETYALLKRGENLSRALSRMPKYFNEADTAVVRSGEKSGELIDVLKYIAQEYEFMYEIRNEYISVMVYPAVLFVVSIGALYVIFTQVMPGVLQILDSFGDTVTLPWTTQMLIDITNFITTDGWMLAVGIALVVGALAVIFSSPSGKKRLDYNIYSIPYLGKVTKYYHLIRFLRFMKLLLYAGMGYDEVFRSLRFIMSSTAYQDLIKDIERAVKGGKTVSSAMQLYEGTVIPTDVIVLLRVGEETASIGKATDNAIWLYKQEFEKLVKNASKVIEPLMVIIMGVVVGFIAMSVFSVIGSILDSVQQ